MPYMSEPIGDLAAGLLLDYFVEEIGPTIYNKAIAHAQARMQLRVSDRDLLFPELISLPAKSGSLHSPRLF